MNTLIRIYSVIFILFLLSFESFAQPLSADHFFRQGGLLQDQGNLSFAVDYYTEALKLDEKNPSILFNRALAYYLLNKPHKAIFDLNRLLELSPADAEAFELRAELRIEVNNVEEALADYSQAILLQPNVNRYLNRALLQAQQGQFILALQDVDMAIHLNPTDAATQTVKADILFAQGKVGRAIKGYHQAIALNEYNNSDLSKQLPIESSTNASILLNKAFYWIGQGKLNPKAIQALELSSRSTDKAFALYCLGLINLRQREYQTALVNFNKAITMDPSLGEYYYGRGVTLTYLQRFNEAEQDLDAASQLGFIMDEKENWLKIPTKDEQLLSSNGDILNHVTQVSSYTSPQVQGLVDKSSFLLKTQQYEEAIILLNQAIHLAPTYSQAYFQKGKALEVLERFEQSIKCYSVTIELQPNQTEALYNRAMVYFKEQLWDLALSDLNQVLIQQPTHKNALFMRAQCHAKMKQWQPALKDYNDYLNKQPHDVFAYNNRGAVKMSLGLAFQALEDFNLGISLDQDFAASFINRARVKYQMGAFTEALVDYNIAIKNAHNNSGIHYERGLINCKLQRYSDAIKDYNTAIKLKGDNADYYYARALAFQNANAPEAAIADYNKVLELDRSYAEAFYNRGIAKRSLEDHTGANQDLFLAAQLGKHSPNKVLTRQ